MQEVSLKDALYFGARTFGENFWFFFKAILITIFLFLAGVFAALVPAMVCMIPASTYIRNFFNSAPKVLVPAKLDVVFTLETVSTYVAQIKSYLVNFITGFPSIFAGIVFCVGILLFLAIIFIVVGVIKVAWIKIYLDMYDKRPNSLIYFRQLPPVTYKILLAYVVYTIISFAIFLVCIIGAYGFARYAYPVGTKISVQPMSNIIFIFYLLSLIPEMYIKLRFLFLDYFIIDTNESVLGSFKKSFYLSMASSTLVFLVLSMFLTKIILHAFPAMLLIIVFDLAIVFFYRKLPQIGEFTQE